MRCARTALTVINPFDSPLEFTGALHTYFTCADVGKVQVLGFEGLTYENSAAGGTKETQAEKLLGFSGEVDRIYYDTPAELYLLNVGASGRHLKLFKMGFPDAVAWNLGKDKAPSMKDLGPGEWEKYVCLEAGAIGKPVTVAPHCSFTAAQTMTAGAALPVEKTEKKRARNAA